MRTSELPPVKSNKDDVISSMETALKKIHKPQPLSPEELAKIQEIEKISTEVGALVESLKSSGLRINKGIACADQKWVNIGSDQLQLGFMSLIRAVAKPDFF